MNLTQWNDIKYFSPEKDNFGDPFMMRPEIFYPLDRLRKYVGQPIVVHCGYEQRKTGGYHPLGLAVDIHIVDMHVVDQFIAASRFDEFNGIGVYPYWNNPGLHLDARPKERRLWPDARWGCIKGEGGRNVYVPLTWDFLKEID